MAVIRILSFQSEGFSCGNGIGCVTLTSARRLLPHTLVETARCGVQSAQPALSIITRVLCTWLVTSHPLCTHQDHRRWERMRQHCLDGRGGVDSGTGVLQRGHHPCRTPELICPSWVQSRRQERPGSHPGDIIFWGYRGSNWGPCTRTTE